jgi:hypothetical protein
VANMSRAWVSSRLRGWWQRGFPFLSTPNLELFYQPAVCPTPKAIASLMVVPRTTMSLMSGAFDLMEIRVADLKS